MALFDTDTWDGNVDNLPESIKAKLPKPAAEPKKEDPAEFDGKLNAALNKRNVEQHLASVKDRVAADKFDAAASSFRNAVLNGGLSLAQAEDLFFKKPSADGILPPKKDPAATQVGATTTTVVVPANGEWTEEKVREKQRELAKMPLGKAYAFRREPANAEFLKAEMKLYSPSVRA